MQTVTQPFALKIIGARPDLLQAFVARGHVEIAVPNPGRGKSRRYSKDDCVLLAVLTRLSAFGIEGEQAQPILRYVGRRLAEDKPFSWEEFFSVEFRQLERKSVGAFVCADTEGVMLGMSEGDLFELRAAFFAEWFRSMEGIIGGQRRRDGNDQIIPEAREDLAGKGYFAEPFLFFPIGEVVNGTMRRFDELVKKES